MQSCLRSTDTYKYLALLSEFMLTWTLSQQLQIRAGGRTSLTPVHSAVSKINPLKSINVTKLTGAVIVASSTIVLLVPWAWACIRRHPIGLAFGHPFRVWSLWILVMLREFLLLAAWFAVLVLMALPKQKDFRNMFTPPSYGSWAVGIAMAVLEM